MLERFATISTIASAVGCAFFLALLPLSTWLHLPSFADDGNSIDPNASFSIASVHCGVSRGRLWLFNDGLPFTGSIIALEGWWGGKRATEHADWRWGVYRYGMEQVSYIDAQGQSAGKARFGDFPGIYYRQFEWWDQERPWKTLAVSLWYPVTACAVLPSWWLIRRLRRRRKTAAVV